MGYPFGKDFTYYFVPAVDNDTLRGIPSQTPNIYVFLDSARPNRTVAASGSGALQSISAWTQRGDGYEIAIGAISDPDVTASNDKRQYWIAINFVEKTAGQTQTIVKMLEMERSKAIQKPISITADDLIGLYPGITGYVSEAQINAFVQLAIVEVQASLLQKGFEWAQVYRHDRLNLAVQMKTLASIFMSQRSEPGDNFDQNYQEYKAIYNATIQAISIEYDNDLDGAPEVTKQSVSTIWLTR